MCEKTDVVIGMARRETDMEVGTAHKQNNKNVEMVRETTDVKFGVRVWTRSTSRRMWMSLETKV